MDLVWAALAIEPGASYLPGKLSVAEPQPHLEIVVETTSYTFRHKRLPIFQAAFSALLCTNQFCPVHNPNAVIPLFISSFGITPAILLLRSNLLHIFSLLSSKKSFLGSKFSDFLQKNIRNTELSK